ncbi:MAG: glycosyltransferase family 4 protein, partial [Daejeonella sp.]|nr:glycosyltransferase family 4 protein [Daejeonella sp.]
MVRKVCIITPGSLASNPRVVKEAEALIDAGFKVHLIYTRHISSLVNHDQAILNDHPEWTSDYLDWSSAKIQPLIIKYLTGAIGRLKYLILKRNLYPDELAPVLINRFYFWQLNKAIASKADLFIAHYPNCIGVAAKAAKLGNTLFGYDAEDYHRGEDLPQP